MTETVKKKEEIQGEISSEELADVAEIKRHVDIAPLLWDGDEYVIFVNIASEDKPPRIMVLPDTYSNTFQFEFRTIPVKEWYAEARVAFATQKIIGIYFHPPSKELIGIFYVVCSDWHIKKNIPIDHVVDKMREFSIEAMLQEVDTYESARLRFQMEDMWQELQTYRKQRFTASTRVRDLMEQELIEMIEKYQAVERSVEDLLRRQTVVESFLDKQFIGIPIKFWLLFVFILSVLWIAIIGW